MWWGVSPEPQAQNPEPRTQNPEPRTLNPEPQVLCAPIPGTATGTAGNIILMLADTIACDARNPVPAAVFAASSHALNLYGQARAPSAVSHQLSAISCQPSAVSCLPSASVARAASAGVLLRLRSARRMLPLCTAASLRSILSRLPPLPRPQRSIRGPPQPGSDPPEP